METASGQANVTDSRRNARRRFRPSPLALGIAAFIAIVAFGTMAVVLLGVYPPDSGSSSQSITDQWRASKTETPAAQRASMLQVEKVGTPVRQGKDIIVKVRVTNHVMQAAAPVGTPQANEPVPPPSQAKVYNGTIVVFFYKTDAKGNQNIVGSGVGSVTDLAYNQSKEIDVTASAVGDYTDWVALPDSVWTDKDPVKPADTPAAAPAAGTPTP